MKKLFFTLILLITFKAVEAQKSAKLYRAGALIGTYSTLDSVFRDAIFAGDSVLLSAHTFYENNLKMAGNIIIQGTMTATDTSTIDAQYKSVIATPRPTAPLSDTSITLRDVICQNGITTSSSASNLAGFGIAAVRFKGYTVVRNCRSFGNTAVCNRGYFYDHVKIYNNEADSFGGVGHVIYAFDSVEICYNRAAYGGAVGHNTGGIFYCNSQGVRVHHNSASIAGGAIYGPFQITGGQITDNQAPLGAAMYTYLCYPNLLQNAKVFNPKPDGSRQNEIYHRSGSLDITGTWFGQNDTTGLIKIGKDYPFCTSLSGKPAKANWSVNRGKVLTNKDTLFPIGAAFTYSDGTPLPAKSLPWLQGAFSSSTGKMLTPNPKISAADTLSSLFRTYVYSVKNDTSSKPINFVCIVDADTFRASPRVWGIDSIKLSIEGVELESQIVVYPNPAKDFINVCNTPDGSQLQLFDLAGKLLLSGRSKGARSVVNITTFPAGQYLLKVITSEGKVGTAKIIIQD